MAYRLLLGADIIPDDQVPPLAIDVSNDGWWLATCEAARHPGLVTPSRISVEI